jgi:hypothetical protein
VNTIGATTPPTAAVAGHGGVATPGGPETPSLLPEPSPSAMTGADPLSMLYLVESSDQELGVNECAKRIAALQAERHQALDQEQRAIQQAIDASKQRGFWDTLGNICGEVAKVAAVVASVAAAVATLGAATPIAAVAIAGAVLSTASFADSELHVLRALGVDDKTTGWVDLGMSLGGAALSVGAGIAAGGRLASSLPSFIDRTSAIVVGAGEVGKGACGIEAGQAQAQNDQAAADQVAARAQSDGAARRMRATVTQAQTSDQQSERIMETIANTKTVQNETSLSAAIAVRG